MAHASDLHLGDDGLAGSMHHHAGCLCPLRNVCREASRARADVLIIAGDLFDHALVEPGMVRTAASMLGRIKPRTVVLPGNHDLQGSQGPYAARIWSQLDRVTVLTDEEGQLVQPLGQLAIWGRPMTNHSPEFQPLLNAPGRLTGSWYVVVAHGHFRERPPRIEDRSSPILLRDLVRLQADYVALGHWQQPRPVHSGQPVAWYSGAVEVSGRPGSILIVDMAEGQVAVTPRRLEPAPKRCPDN